MNKLNPRWLRFVQYFGYMPRRQSKYRPHQGDRECARRRGEIGHNARRRT